MTDNNHDTPVPATAEPTPEGTDETPQVSAKPTISPALRGLLGGLAGGLAITLIAVGGVIALWPDLHDVLLGSDVRRLSQLEHAIDDLNPRLVAVEREQIRSNSSADAAGMAQSLVQRVAALEAQAHAPLADPRIGALAERADRLSSDVARLIADVQALRGAIPPEGTILRLAERTEAAEKAVRVIAQQHASAEALLLVVGQLRAAVDRGDPYAVELQAVRRITGRDDLPQINALAASAAEGVVRKEILIGRFPAIAKDAVEAEMLPPDDGLWQHALHKLASLIEIRRIDGQGTGTTAIVARAENWIKAGDVTKAAQELEALSGRPSEVAAPWLKAAKTRDAADRALSELSANTAAQGAATGG
jgi:uroporphyrinogen-III synthase